VFPGQGRAKKSLGQHFLRDEGVLGEIVGALEPVPGETVLEIGPGRGALTAHLLAAGLAVRALELDSALLPLLEERFGHAPGFSLLQGDAALFDYGVVGDSCKVVGNLPFNRGADITHRLVEFSPRIPLMVLMYQKEVARRVAALPGGGEYGYLSCLVQYHYRAEYLFTVPAGSFRPVPKVDAGVVRLHRLTPRPLGEGERERLFRLIRHLFTQRRKTILRSLLSLPGGGGARERVEEALAGLGLDPRRRPETLSLEEFIALSRSMVRVGRGSGGGEGT
jgi:16S rRNA (adenine1518-N6/adenine1519-N6)-dimethyltransferase